MIREQVKYNKFIITLIIFSLGIIFITKKASSQFYIISDQVLVAGYVFEEKTLEPIPYVNIFVKQTRRGTITNSDGYFILRAKLNDTIVFSSLGYERKYTAITDTIKENNESLVILLKDRFYELRTVDIIALRRYEQLKYEVSNLKLPDDGFVYAINNFPERAVDIDYYSRAGLSDFGFVFSPITALYDAFSKEGKERRKLEALIERDKKKDFIESKISIEKISKITNMDIYESEDFLEWCNFPVDFIERLNDYDLILLIMHKYNQWKRLNNE